MDPILSSISIAQHRSLENSLANLNFCSNAELRPHLIQVGLTEPQADQALRYRSIYALFIFLEGNTPVLKGYEALTLWKGQTATLREILEQIPQADSVRLREEFSVLDEHPRTRT